MIRAVLSHEGRLRQHTRARLRVGSGVYQNRTSRVCYSFNKARLPGAIRALRQLESWRDSESYFIGNGAKATFDR